MKKKIASLFYSLAKAFDPTIGVEKNASVVKLGIGYHITKSDVRKFRCEHPEYTSHRKGLEAIIEDTKTIILGNIAAGIKEKGLVEYSVKKSFWTADVRGSINLYGIENGQKEK